MIAKPEEKEAATLGPFVTAYFSGRANLKPNTKRNYATNCKLLIQHFGEGRLLTEISPGDADDWRESLLLRFSAATVSREVKRARQFFRAAVRKRLIDENPFVDLASPAQTNSSREYFGTAADVAKVLDACPDTQWRLIVALSRFGGLRCPSEHLALKGGDIDWERGRMTPRPNTTRAANRGSFRSSRNCCPIWNELGMKPSRERNSWWHDTATPTSTCERNFSASSGGRG